MTDIDRLVRSNRILSRVFVVAVLMLAGGIVYSFILTDDVGDRVTRIEQSPCQENPTGRECQQVKVDSDRARTVGSACVITRKAGLGCPALEKQGGSDDAKPKNTAAPGAAPRGGSGSAGPAPTPSEPSPAGPTPPPASPPSPPDPPDPPPDPPGPVPPPTPQPPSVGSGADQVLDGVGQTVEGAKGTVCGLAGVCLP